MSHILIAIIYFVSPSKCDIPRSYRINFDRKFKTQFHSRKHTNIVFVAIKMILLFPYFMMNPFF